VKKRLNTLQFPSIDIFPVGFVQTEIGELAAQVSRLTQEKSSLDIHLGHICTERDKLKELLLTSKGQAEIKVLHDRYQHEINALEKKVKPTPSDLLH